MACCVADDRPGQRRSWTTTSSSTRWRRDSDRVGTAFRVYSLQASPLIFVMRVRMMETEALSPSISCRSLVVAPPICIDFPTVTASAAPHALMCFPRPAVFHGLFRIRVYNGLRAHNCLDAPACRCGGLPCSWRDTRLGGRSRIKPTNNRTAEMADAQRTSLRSSGFC